MTIARCAILVTIAPPVVGAAVARRLARDEGGIAVTSEAGNDAARTIVPAIARDGGGTVTFSPDVRDLGRPARGVISHADASAHGLYGEQP